MKKIILIQYAAIGILYLLLSTGCVKDNVLAPAADSDVSSRKALELGGFITDLINAPTHGRVKGTILPPEAKARLFLIGSTTIELPLDSNGAIISNDVPTGNYSVYIEPGDYTYQDYLIENVTVNAGLLTDLGTIILEYVYYGGSGCEIGWGRTKPGKRP